MDLRPSASLRTSKGYKKAIIVTGGSSMQKFGFLQKVEQTLKDTGLEVQIFEGVEPDPPLKPSTAGREAMRNFQPDVIVAIGGGSRLTPPRLWGFLRVSGQDLRGHQGPLHYAQTPPEGHLRRHPSTSGTASEVTAFSVITDYSTNIKYPLADFEITPDIAILDTDIPLTMPKKLTAHTGMDALTHAIEAMSPLSAPISPTRWRSRPFPISLTASSLPTMGTRTPAARCTSPSAWPEWPSPTPCLALRTAWPTRPALCSTSRTAAATPFCCLMSFSTTPRPASSVTPTLPAPSDCPATYNQQLCNSLVDAIKDLNKKLNIEQTYQANGVSEELFQQQPTISPRTPSPILHLLQSESHRRREHEESSDLRLLRRRRNLLIFLLLFFGGETCKNSGFSPSFFLIPQPNVNRSACIRKELQKTGRSVSPLLCASHLHLWTLRFYSASFLMSIVVSHPLQTLQTRPRHCIMSGAGLFVAAAVLRSGGRGYCFFTPRGEG